jgi:hypothetical protein
VQNVYLNTANSISGATLIGQATIANGFVGSLWSRNILIKSASSTIYFPSNVNANTDIVLNAFGFGNTNFDWTVNQYLVIAVQPSAITQLITHFSTVITPH